jgi:hypothetical protein
MLEDELSELIDRIKDKLTPDLLKPQYREQNANNPMFGHCYVATEAFYHLTKDDHPGRFSIYHGKDDEGIVHWWLHDNKNTKLVDITADQYYSIGKTPPYEKSRRGSFLTNDPSKRAVIVMKRVRKDETVIS